MDSPVIGLLPFYLKLYDDVVADRRPRIDAFAATMAEELEKRGATVLTSPPCRVRAEFEAAVEEFEAGGAEALVTLHLAYSPSLESAEVLSRTKLPIIVLDTTPTYDYSPGQDPEELMYNHGIHGVQDMCNLLLRTGTKFAIEAGHWKESDVLDRVMAHVEPARMAHRMRTGRTGIVGDPFEGMGDFAVDFAELAKTIGMKVVQLAPEQARKLVSSVTDKEVRAEMESDRAAFDTAELSEETHARSVRVGLAIRRWIETEKLGAWSVNFLDVTRSSGVEAVPFLEAGKLMARGIGYAGEGDVLTATLVGSLLRSYPRSSFTEMFCADWRNNTIFLSHMGEINPVVVAGKPAVREMPYAYSDADNPAYLSGCLTGGEVILVDLAPLAEGRYRLILAPATMLDIDPAEDRMQGKVRGWFRPGMPIRDFLTQYSRVGGTHHLAVCYGAPIEQLEELACIMDWETKRIG